MSEMEFEFSKFLATRSKSLCLGVFEPTKWLAAQGTVRVLRHRLCKQVFVKENEKNISIKEACKILETVNFFPANDYLLLESCQLYVIAMYKASDCRLDQICQTCFFYSSL